MCRQALFSQKSGNAPSEFNDVSRLKSKKLSVQPFSTLGDFLSAGNVFRLPIYQRQYSWESQQLEDLWNDLYYLETGKRYYFGTILLKKTEEEERAALRTYEILEVIDGQQRIASVLILLGCILDRLYAQAKTDQERSEIEDMKNTYLTYNLVPKLRLLGQDSIVYNTLVVQGEKQVSGTITTASQRRLLGAKAFFEEKLDEEQQQRKLQGSNYREFLLEFMKKALRMEIMKHVVETDEEAVLIFETVNDRGIELGSLDRTKSFLMHFLYLNGAACGENLRRVNDIFASIFSNLECLEARKRAVARSVRELEKDLQRVHYIIFKSGSTYFFDAFSSLKQDLISRYRDPEREKNKDECVSYALDYAQSLGTAYSVMKEVLTYDRQDEICSLLDRIFVQSYGTALPLLVCSWMKFGSNSEEVKILLRAIECFLFRYSSFRSRRSYTTVDRINSKSFDLYHGKVTFDSVLSSLRYLTKHYASDSAFRADLESENFYFGTKSTIKLLFYEYEQFLRGGSKLSSSVIENIPLTEWMSDKYQIDHIWAQTALASGRDYQEYDRCGNKLGNLTILPSVKNTGLLNANFSLKRNEYKKLDIEILKEIAVHEQWREREINERTTKVADFAMKRWAIP
jgi:uncharacterized protein with ParB-like and HNH nuclease domain